MVVEGSEIKDNVPFFNGMKNVQMGGIKLVNIARGAVVNSLVSSNANGTQYTYTSNGSTSWGDLTFDKALLKPNTVYTVYMNIVSNTSDNGIKIQLANGKDGILNISKGTTGIIKQAIVSAQTLVDSDKFALYFRNSSISGQQTVIQNPMIIEGDWTHLDEIPYIESEMIIEQPVIRSQGKNLFDINQNNYFTASNTDTQHSISGNALNISGKWYIGKYMDLKPNTTYTLSWSVPENTPMNRVAIHTGRTTNTITYVTDGNKLTFTTPNSFNDIEVLFYASLSDSVENTVSYSNIQLELGNTATPYEPFKHQTLYSNRVIGYEENC